MRSLKCFTKPFRLRSLEREFDAEIRFHLEERTRRNLAVNMTPREANEAARARFGSIRRAKRGMRAAHLRPLGMVVFPVFVAALVGLTVHWRTTSRIYDLGADVTAPVPIARSNPEYTAAAKGAKIQGTVRVQCVVRPTGACTDLAVLRSVDRTFGLDQSAVTALRAWRFKPAVVHGNSVAARVSIDFTFALH